MFAPSAVTLCPRTPIPPSHICKSISIDDFCCWCYCRHHRQRWCGAFMCIAWFYFDRVTETVVAIGWWYRVCAWPMTLSWSTTAWCWTRTPVTPTAPTSMDCNEHKKEILLIAKFTKQRIFNMMHDVYFFENHEQSYANQSYGIYWGFCLQLILIFSFMVTLLLFHLPKLLLPTYFPWHYYCWLLYWYDGEK